MPKAKLCFICGTQNVKHYANSEIYEYIQCLQCGLVYLKDMPNENDTYKAYNGGSFKSFRRKVTAPFRRLESLFGYEERVLDFKERLQIIFSYFSKIDNLHLLDIDFKNVYQLLKKGGVFLFQTPNIKKFGEQLGFQRVIIVGDMMVIMIE